MKRLLLLVGVSVFQFVRAEGLPPLVGDGVADDTAAIQARIDSGASCVYLPPPKKCYRISKTLRIGSDTELRRGTAWSVRRRRSPSVWKSCGSALASRRVNATRLGMTIHSR